MKTAIVNATVLSGGQETNGKAVMFDAGNIVGIVPNNDLPTSVTNVIDATGKMLVPGFVDIQVNGGGGVLFNNEPTLDAIVRIGEAHAQFGTTGFLPTLISANLE